MTHWLDGLLGKPWRPGAHGPDAFDAWSLVREALKRGYGIELPILANETASAVEQLGVGWAHSSAPPIDCDVVVMNGVDGRHVGLMIACGRGLRLLHADGKMTAHGPVGVVAAQRLSHVLAAKFLAEVELWRRE